jgi:hypothetical protein
VPAGEPDPVVQAAGAELEQAIGDVVQSLGASYRDVLHLHLREGLAAHEIAQRLGRPAGTVRTQIVRGVHELRRRLPTGFAGGLAPAWFAGEPTRIATAVREAVIAAAKAQHAAVVGAAAFTARTGLLLAALAATVVVGIGLAWLLPRSTAVATAQYATATAGGDARALTRDGTAAPDGGIAAASGAPAAASSSGPPLAREAVAATPLGADAEVRVLVRDAEARPLAGARVWLCDSTWSDDAVNEHVAFAAARTGDEGVARFAAPVAALDTIVVLANGRRPVQLARSIPSGEQEVVIGQQLSITGIVIVDGGRPGEPIELVARCGSSEGVWCDAARTALAPFDPTEAAASAIADAAGRFAFFGLPTQVECEITPLTRVFKKPGTDRTEPAVKATPLAIEVALELARVPVIRGRCVLPQGTPAQGREQVSIWPRFVRSNGWSEWHTPRCKLGEQFAVAVFDSGLVSTIVDFRFGRSRESPVVATRTVPCPFAGVHDLGDVVVDDPSTERELQIVDRDGAPIAGACVLSLGKLSAPASVDGRIRVIVGPGPAKLVAGAKGYRIRTIHVAEASPQPLQIVLEPANRLRIEAHAAAGVQLGPLKISLGFTELPHDDDVSDRIDVSELRGAKVRQWSATGGGLVEFSFDMLSTGELELFDLPAALEFTVQLCDRFGHPIDARRVRMGVDERRDVRFVVSQPARRLAGRVVDSDGHPLRGVKVYVGSVFHDLRSDADGRFDVDGVLGTPELRFDKEGFQQLNVTGAELFERTTFRLEHAK